MSDLLSHNCTLFGAAVASVFTERKKKQENKKEEIKVTQYSQVIIITKANIVLLHTSVLIKTDSGFI